MKVITNEKSVKRNAQIGKYTMIAGFVLFATAMYFNITGMKDPQNIPQWQIWYMYGAMIGGFIILQISVYLGNRFGRRPRVDERIAAALKGLTKDYTLYNYLTPVSHLLVGPAGVWVIEPYYQRGTIVYEKNRWKQKGGGLMLGYLKIFAQEGLGRPDLEVQTDLEALTGALKKSLGDDLPPLNASLVFFDPRADLQVEEAPHPTMKLEDLKDFLRKKAKENPLPTAQIKKITDLLPQESIE